MSKEAMKLALEALESYKGFIDDAHIIEGQWQWIDGADKAITTLKQALEQPEPEPVAWRTFDGEGGYDYRDYDMNENYHKEWAERNPNHAHWVEPLYTSPPKREPLTDEEIALIVAECASSAHRHDDFSFARAIEAAHGIKGEA